MARRKPKRAATAPRPPAAANPAPSLEQRITALAQKHRLGTVGLVGARARGNETPWHPVELFVTRSFDEAAEFARELSRTAYLAVHLYAFDLVPWAHPLHLCVRWLNVDSIPVTECPPGAVMRWKLGEGPDAPSASMPLESLPHFRAAQKFVSTRTFPKSGEFVRMFGPPPIGGFLMNG